MPLLNTEGDTGKIVKSIFLNSNKVLGGRIYGATDCYAPERIISDWKELSPANGVGAKLDRLPDAISKGIIAARGSPEQIPEEMLQNEIDV